TAGNDAVSAAVRVSHVVLADVPAVVTESVLVEIRLRQKQQAGVLVDVGRQDDDTGRLLLHLSLVVDVLDSRNLPFVVGKDFGDAAVRPDLELVGFFGFSNRGDEGARLGIVPAAMSSAVPAIGAGGPPVVVLANDRGR